MSFVFVVGIEYAVLYKMDVNPVNDATVNIVSSIFFYLNISINYQLHFMTI